MTDKGDECNIQVVYNPHGAGPDGHSTFNWACSTCDATGEGTWDIDQCGAANDDVVTVVTQPNILIALAEQRIEELKVKANLLMQKIEDFKPTLEVYNEMVEDRCRLLREIDGYLQAIRELK